MESDTPSKQELHLSGITGVILTCDGERLLDKCLASLAFCDSIVVVDSGSKDATASIAKKYNATFVFRAWEGFASQFTYAHSLVTTRWFFILDQDEICPPKLAAAIKKAIQEADAQSNYTVTQSISPAPASLASSGVALTSTKLPATGSQEMVAFTVGRKSWYFDRFMKHGGWYPDHILRVFRVGYVEFYEDAHIHYRPLGQYTHIDAPKAEIIHYPYISFFHQLQKLNSYAEQGAKIKREEQGGGGILQGIGHGVFRFIRIYILKKGFLDGRAGFMAAAHGAFYAFCKYARVMESSWGAPFDWENYEDD